MADLVQALISPAGLALGPLLLALLLWRRRRLAFGLVAVGALCLYVLSSPLLVAPLVSLLEDRYPVLTEVPPTAQAIVVLGAGRNFSAAEYGASDTVNAFGLERLRYGAWLQRRTGLPLMVAGGGAPGRADSVAALSAPIVGEELGASVRWLETQSRNTYENAREAARILRPEGIEHVLVVTHAMHMPRAMWSFRRAGLSPVAAPTAHLGHGDDPGPWPSPWAQVRSALLLHELVGLAFYRLRY